MIFIMAGLAACGSSDPATSTPTAGSSTVLIPCSTADLITEINNANSTPLTAVTLELGPGCTYELDAVDNVTDGSNGLPSIISPITIIGNGSIIQRSSTSGTPLFRLIHIGARGRLELNNVTLTNGDLADSDPGGAIFVGGFLATNASNITNNRASDGGGIYHGDNTSSIFITTTIFSDNQAVGGMGGAIYNGDPSAETLTDAVIRESSFSHNEAERGGAIASVGYSIMDLRNTFLDNNTAAIGGAIYNEENGKMVIDDTTITFNGADLTGSAGEFGGGDR